MHCSVFRVAHLTINRWVEFLHFHCLSLSLVPSHSQLAQERVSVFISIRSDLNIVSLWFMCQIGIEFVFPQTDCTRLLQWMVTPICVIECTCTVGTFSALSAASLALLRYFLMKMSIFFSLACVQIKNFLSLHDECTRWFWSMFFFRCYLSLSMWTRVGVGVQNQRRINTKYLQLV